MSLFYKLLAHGSKSTHKFPSRLICLTQIGGRQYHSAKITSPVSAFLRAKLDAQFTPLNPCLHLAKRYKTGDAKASASATTTTTQSANASTKIEDTSSADQSSSPEAMVVANSEDKHDLNTTAIDTTSIVKWEVTSEPLSLLTKKLSSAALTWSQMTFMQKLFFPISFLTVQCLGYFETVLPFWLSIMATVTLMRILIVPLSIKAQRIKIKDMNISPQAQKIQQRMRESLAFGDPQDSSLEQARLSRLYNENGLGPKERFFPILAQTPFFLTMFITMRRLIELQHVGMLSGGALWFQNLAIKDPYYALPAVAAGLNWFLIYLMMPAGAKKSQKLIAGCIPLGIFAFCANFPAAINLCWVTTNSFTILLTVLFNIKSVQKLCKIPTKIIHKPEELPLAKLSWKESMQNMMDRASAAKPTADLRRLDELEFKKAGTNPLRKVYKANPLESNSQKEQ